MENPEGRGGHTANPFRGGGGVWIFSGNTLCKFPNVITNMHNEHEMLHANYDTDTRTHPLRLIVLNLKQTICDALCNNALIFSQLF